MSARTLLAVLCLLAVTACDGTPSGFEPDEASPEVESQYTDYLEARNESRQVVPEVAAFVAKLLDGVATAEGGTDGCDFSGNDTTGVEYDVSGRVDSILEPRPWFDTVRFALDESGWEVGELESDDTVTSLGAERDGLTLRFAEYQGDDRLVFSSGSGCWSVPPGTTRLTGQDEEDIVIP